MATQLFLLNTVADTHLGTNNANLIGTGVGWTSRALGTARGSGVVASDNTATVAGTTLGVEVKKTDTLEWLSPPVSATVTISGAITGNIWAEESNMSANVAINFVVDVVRATNNSLVQIVKSAFITEAVVGTGVRAVNNFTATPGAGVAVNRGDRLRVRVFGDDAGTMGSGFTFDIGYNGTTGAADGDTYVSFTETFAFESAPAGSQFFLTNAQSGLTAAPTLVSSFAGADENPLSEGGNWANLNSSGNPLQLLSNTVTGSVAFPAVNSSYWTPANFGPDLEAYATIGGAVRDAAILFRIQGEGGAATWDGYAAYAAPGASVARIVRFDNSVLTVLVASGSVGWGAGDKIGVRASGSTFQVFRFPSGGSTWQLLATAVDATYASAGKIGLYMVGISQTTLDNFFASTGSSLLTQQATNSRGGGIVSYVSDTTTGWTPPLYAADWYTGPLSAFTLQGLAQANLRALENNITANTSLRCEVASVNSDGTSPTVWASWCIAPTGTDNGELTTSEVARTANVSGDALSVTDGQRLRVRLYVDDTSNAAMADTFTVQLFYNGTSGGASGDSFITFAQTITLQPTSVVPNINMAPQRA